MPKAPNATILQLQRDCDEDWTALELFHAIPRDLLTSIVQGTVAFDCENQQHRYDESTTDPGVYVIAISIKDRGGKFLNWNEYQAVIASLRTYLRAFEALQLGSSQSHGDLTFARAIDGIFGGRAMRRNSREYDRTWSVQCRAQADSLRDFIDPLVQKQGSYPGLAGAEVH